MLSAKRRPFCLGLNVNVLTCSKSLIGHFIAFLPHFQWPPLTPPTMLPWKQQSIQLKSPGYLRLMGDINNIIYSGEYLWNYTKQTLREWISFLLRNKTSKGQSPVRDVGIEMCNFVKWIYFKLSYTHKMIVISCLWFCLGVYFDIYIHQNINLSIFCNHYFWQFSGNILVKYRLVTYILCMCKHMIELKELTCEWK